MHTAQPKACRPAGDTVVEIAKAAGDERRANLIRLLHHDSFSVKELAQVFDVAQPAISHHLKVLREAGLVQQRREGNNIYYQRCATTDSPLIRELFAALDEAEAPTALRKRLASVHRARERSVRAFFESNEDALKSQRMLISETSVYADSLAALWQTHTSERHRALEVGPGDAEIIQRLAVDFRHVTGIDSSRTMLQPVREQTASLKRVTLEQADISDFSSEPYDAVVAAMVLHHQTSPRAFFRHAKARLNAGGVLLIAELDRHEHDWVRDACGDLWLGFTPEELDSWAQSVGLHLITRQFLAQRNGFSIQLASYAAATH